MRTPDDFGDRQLRRAVPACRAQEAAAADPFPLNICDLKEVGEAADRRARTAVLLSLRLDPAMSGDHLVAVETPSGEFALPVVAAPLIAFAAHQFLEARGVACQVVAGAAIWSVGPGDMDILDHGVCISSRVPRQLVAKDHFHTWLTVQGHLVDFASRHLHRRFEEAGRDHPFSTPPCHWRTFPETLVHLAGVAMPDPRTDVDAPYAYHPGGPSLLDEVRRHLASRIAHL